MKPLTRRCALRLATAAGVAGIAGCGLLDEGPNERPPADVGTTWNPPADEWWFPHGDLRNSRASSVAVTGPPSIAWRVRAETDSSNGTSPLGITAATRDSLVLGGASDGRIILESYDPPTGTRQWVQRIPAPDVRYESTGGIVDERLYLTDTDKHVIAVDLTEGTILWRRNLYEQLSGVVPQQYLKRDHRPFFARAMGTPQTVYVQSSYGLHGLSPDDGREEWRLSFGGRRDHGRALFESSGLAVARDRIWTSYRIDGAYAVQSVSDDVTVSRTDTEMREAGHPVMSDEESMALSTGVDWSSSTSFPLATILSGSRETPWQFPGFASSGAVALSSLATDGDNLYGCEAHENGNQFVVFSLQPRTGEIEWLYRESFIDRGIVAISDDLRVCDPCVAGDNLLVGYGAASGPDDRNGSLFALSTVDGTVRWSMKLPLAPIDMALAGDRLYVRGQTNEAVALRIPE
jgi:outer membrane protein assembly factor BamB